MNSFNKFIQECPQLMTNFHSATQSSFVCHQNLKECNLNEHNLPDYGGSSVFIDYSSKMHTLQIKKNGIGGSPYVSKICSLPLELKSKMLDYEAINFNKNFFKNMIYDPDLNVLIRADYKPCIVQMDKVINKEDNDKVIGKNLLPIFKFSSSNFYKNEIIQEVTQTYKIDNSRQFFIKYSKNLSMIEVDISIIDEEMSCKLKMEHTLNIKDITQNISSPNVNLSPLNQFLFISKNIFLSSKMAIALNSENYEKYFVLIDYDLNHHKPIWFLNSISHTFSDLTFKYPNNLICVQNHPKLLTYCETKTFGLFDTRIKPESSFKTLISRKELPYVREWERFRAFQCLSLNNFQFIIALDHKLILIDSRYPGQNLLQWNHMINHHANNQIRFLNSDMIKSENDHNYNLITLANNNQVCLLTLESSDFNIVQPCSLHHPLHVSRVDDSWYFSSSTSQTTKQRLSSVVLTGLSVVPFSTKFAIYQMTNKGDIFFQDFFNQVLDNTQVESNWNKFALFENCNIDSKHLDFLNHQFFKIEKSMEEEINQTLQNKTNCECCQQPIKLGETDEKKLWTKNSIKKWRRSRKQPKNENIPFEMFQRFSSQDIISGKFQPNSLLMNNMKALYNDNVDEFKAKWGKFTCTLLDKWMNNDS